MADIWDTDYHELRVNRGDAELFAERYRGSMRLQLGLICTEDEFEAERKSVLDRLFS